MGLAVTIFSATLCVAFFNARVGFVTAIISLGFASGVWGVLCSVSFMRYFGRKHLGVISGLTMSIDVIASAVGPVLFSYGKLCPGSYHNAVLTILILPVIIFVMSFFAFNPQRNDY